MGPTAPAPSPSITDWISAGSSALYTSLTLLLVIFAVTAWKTAKAALSESRRASEAAITAANAQQEANEQSKLDSRARTRPYVYTEVVPGLQGPGTFDLRVVNAGRSLAVDVEISATEWPLDTNALAEALRYTLGSKRSIPPGRAIRLLWRSIESDTSAPTGMAEVVRLNVNYRSVDEHQYTEVLDVRCTDSILWPVPEDGDPYVTGDLSDLTQFYSLLQVVARRLGEITR